MNEDMNNEPIKESEPPEDEFRAQPSPEYRFADEPVHMPPPSPDLPPRYKKPKKGLSGGGIVALALCCSLLGGAIGTGGALLATRDSRKEVVQETPTVVIQGERETAPVETAVVNTDQLLTASQVYTQNVESTVGITVGITTNFWGYQTTSAASGSGFILSEDGYILTNFHVIDDADAGSITVTTYDNKSYNAKAVGYDEKNDIAVLKIDAQGLRPVILGDSGALTVGETVLAIGNPLGELTFSLTQGVVSALEREITLSSGSTMTLIQTDTAINSGNSGGPLFNLHGEVVGIVNAKYSSSSSSGSASIDNIGFAIPISSVKNIVKSIIENGYIIRPYIGVSVATVNKELQSYGIPQGAAVKVVGEDSPAQAAGLMVNDVITAIDGKEITTSSELVNIVSACSPGDTLELTVYRQGHAEQLSITLTVGSQQQDALAKTSSQEQREQQGGGQFNPFGSFPFGFGFG